MAWSRARFRRIATVVVAISACAGACVAWSAELAVRVVDGDGVALPGVMLGLHPVGPVPGAGVPPSAARPPSTATDLAGRAAFSGLAPGIYRVSLPGSGLEERWLLTPPTDDTVVTLPDERAHAELTLVLPRGDRLVVTIETDESSSACASIQLVEQARGGEFPFAACSRQETRRIVPPGRWTVTASGEHSGAVFESLALDGVPAPGAVAEFEVTAGGRTHDLRLRYGSGCTVSGHARWNVGDSPPASVCARLVAPGPRLAAALAAGEKQPDHGCFPIAASGGWSGRWPTGPGRSRPRGSGCSPPTRRRLRSSAVPARPGASTSSCGCATRRRPTRCT